jgi:hypothetical protein
MSIPPEVAEAFNLGISLTVESQNIYDAGRLRVGKGGSEGAETYV